LAAALIVGIAEGWFFSRDWLFGDIQKEHERVIDKPLEAFKMTQPPPGKLLSGKPSQLKEEVTRSIIQESKT
jgi:hypothetical protein